MKRVTRDDLLKRIPSGSPYEAVIVAAREARRMNRARISRMSLLGPLPHGISPPGSPVGEDHPFSLPASFNEGNAPDDIAADVPLRPASSLGEDEVTKVTMTALQRVAEGEVSYEIAEGPVDPEED